uniref:cAMP-dependent protein kinase inhibitor beta n=2 Tax=Nothoprocta TaxID=8806 RepID=A0A8C6ZVP1_NOTPE
MTDVEPGVTDFAASGRAGRRNALPDILGSPAGAGTADLPHKLAELSVSEGNAQVSSSKASLESQDSEGKSSDS